MRNLKRAKSSEDISKIKYGFYVFDTETTKLEPMPKNFVFGVIYGYNRVKVIHSVEEFREEFKNENYKGKYIFAHNAEFDLLTIFGNVITELDNKAIFNNSFISAKYEGITFGDSMNIYPTSVKRIGELLGLNKLNNEKVKEGKLTKKNVTNADINYCITDCKIIFDALLRIFEDTGKIRLTLASLSMFQFKSKYLPKDIMFSEKVDDFYESYYGGRTEAFHIGKVNSKLYDINSLYPYIMKTIDFPDIVNLKREIAIDDKYLMHLLKWEEGMAKVTVRHKDTYFGYLPVRMKIGHAEKLVFPVGEFTTTVNFNELRYAIDSGVVEILKVHSVTYGTPIDSPFVKFVEDNYLARQQATDQLNKTIYKLRMNSLYGRFGMRMKKTTTYYDEIPFELMEELDEQDKEYSLRIFNADRVDCYLETENEQMKASFSSIPTYSSYITSAARVMLLQNLVANEKNGVTYCDTDSIALDGEFIGKISDKLGDFKLEPKTLIEVNGLKNYKYLNHETGETHDVIKGVSRGSKKIEGTEVPTYETKKYFKSKQGLRQDKEAGESYTQTKELKHRYDKRIVLSDGSTKPIKLSLDVHTS